MVHFKCIIISHDIICFWFFFLLLLLYCCCCKYTSIFSGFYIYYYPGLKHFKCKQNNWRREKKLCAACIYWMFMSVPYYIHFYSHLVQHQDNPQLLLFLLHMNIWTYDWMCVKYVQMHSVSRGLANAEHG